ncbi:YkuS family protein [Caldalkalibacillus salinus]|uniref:YkuS family protein n=1 Tax=Caldalkalibacillus salinus TaxID=2803787 RepID=UPI0019239560|nr:YkuS family protein [Caldalkalibacillus salinus]
MHHRVAVENSLGNVKNILQQNGYEVVNLEANQSPECECYCISGQDQNVMGMQDATTQASVINCAGLSEEQVLQEVQQRLEAQS